MEIIDLTLNKENELEFEIQLEGNITSRPEMRLVCEDYDVSFSFKGKETSNGVRFTIPKMENRIKPGEYKSKLEIFVENQYIKPMEFISNFQKETGVAVKSAKIKNINENRQTPVQAKASIKKKPTQEKTRKVSKEELRKLLKR